MRLLSVLGNKQGSKYTTWFVALPLLVAGFAAPQLAFAMDMPFTNITQPALWQSAQAAITTDPVLFDAATTAPQDPHNTYDTNAWATGSNSPITTVAKWPKKSTQVAWTPVLESFDNLPNHAVPTDGSAKLVLQGTASYYSRAGCLGCDANVIMANGQPLRDEVATMAIGAQLKQYVGYHARVTSLATGKSIVVPITDTGGFYQAKYGYRVADLSVATKEAIGMKGGLGPVKVEVL